MKKVVILIFFTMCLYSQIQKTTIEVKGYGQTEQKAIYNGLIHAVEQGNGLSIASRQTLIRHSLKSKLLTQSGNLKFKLTSKEAIKAISTATSGFIDSYSIADIQKDANGYIAYLSVVTSEYKTPGLNPNKRRKLAVFPFEYKNSYVIFNRNEDGKEVSDRFTQSLVTKITQARKFTVLDRENNNYYQAEKNFLLSGNLSKDELLKLGERLGVDYMVVGKILDMNIGKVTEKNNIGLPETSSLICGATISYRIIAMATQQIKWSETISKEFTIEENSNQKSIEAIVANANDKISEVILSNILNNIYPPKIVSVTSNSVIVNQGGNSISKGDSFKAYGKGQRLVDPYTKEFLGYEEIEAGEIEITKVNPKVSYARVLRGKVSEDMILRKLESGTNTKFQSDGEAVTDVKINENGGVILPF